MTKTVLIVSASFRKGSHSDRLAEEFARGALESGNAVEKIRLSEQKIDFCRGCFACQKTGQCVIRDDMAEILIKMKESDLIVFATPIYFYGMCGAMKNFLDRTFPLYPNQQHFRKVYLIAAAEENLDTTIQGVQTGLEGWIRCFDSVGLSGTIFAGGVTDREDIEGHPALHEAYIAGKKL